MADRSLQLSALWKHLRGQVLALMPESLAEFAAREDLQANARMPRVNGQVAIIPVYGVMTRDGIDGGVGMKQTAAAIEYAKATPGIRGVVMYFDTPGGTVVGTPEFSESIHSLRGVKPVVSYSDGLVASAGFWSATAADKVVLSKSAEIGSHGVWMAHEDISKFLDDIGVKITLVSAGKHKVDGHPFEPLPESVRADMQAEVDESMKDFTAALAAHRGVTTAHVLAEFGQGKCFGAAEAKRRGMIDRIDSLSGVLSAMGAQVASGRDSGLVRELCLAMELDAEPVIGKAVEVAAGRRKRRERELGLTRGC